MTLTVMKSSGPKAFVATMVSVVLDLYQVLEAILTYMKNIKLTQFSGEIFTNCSFG